MRVLVTGAAGLVGQAVVARLTAAGWWVRAHDRVPANPSRADEVVRGDLCDTERVEAAVADVDAVVHAAAIPSPRPGENAMVFANNVVSAFRVLDAAGRNGVERIVYISSLSGLGIAWSRYELSPREAPVTEEHPFVGDDAYGLSKYVTEEIGATVARAYGGSVIGLRFPFVGHGDRLRAQLERVHRDPGYGRSDLWGWLDTRDAARAVEASLSRPLTGHHVINIVAPDTSALEPTAVLLRRYHPTTRLTEPLEGFGTVFSTLRSRELLDFTAAYQWREHRS